jgi:hypothetical protein
VKRPWRGARGPRSNISATLPLGSVGFEREPDANGERLIRLEPHVLDKLTALPRPGESYGDAILRLVELVEAEAIQTRKNVLTAYSPATY